MEDHCVAAPGAFNALCAKAIERSGFDAMYVSGAATSVSAGVPDVGVLTLDHFARVVREAAQAADIPMIADADTGFGEGEMVRRTVMEYARAGAAGLHLEDQVFPKRCGHLDGKVLLPTDHAAEKIAIAADAARECPGADTGGFIVCARTDARGVDGLDAAIERSKVYVQAGADMIFPEGLHSEEEFKAFADAMQALDSPPYLLANMTEFGKSPAIPLQRLDEMGYSIVIYPVSTLRIAMGAVEKFLAHLKEAGTVDGTLEQMQTRDELYSLIGYDPAQTWLYPRPPKTV